MTKSSREFDPVHLMNVGQRQADAEPRTKPTDLGCESVCTLLSPTSTIAILLILGPKPDTHVKFSSTIFKLPRDYIHRGLK